MSAASNVHRVGEAPLCAECGESLKGSGFAFRDASGSWVHHECGLKLGNDEIKRRGYGLKQVSGTRGFPSADQERTVPKTTAWDSMSLEQRHKWVNDRLRKESELSGYSPEFRESQTTLRKKLEKEYFILSGVNQQRLGKQLEPVPDWATWKRMGEVVQAPLPGPKRSTKGGCLKTGFIIALVAVALFFVGPVLLGLFF